MSNVIISNSLIISMAIIKIQHIKSSINSNIVTQNFVKKELNEKYNFLKTYDIKTFVKNKKMFLRQTIKKNILLTNQNKILYKWSKQTTKQICDDTNEEKLAFAFEVLWIPCQLVEKIIIVISI